jgi:hypothetical protein
MTPTGAGTPLDLRIDRLRLAIRNAAGHEHRLGPIAERAAALLARGLDAPRPGGRLPAPARPARSPVRVDLARMSDDAVAHRIARAWLAVLTPTSGADHTAAGERRGASWSR